MNEQEKKEYQERYRQAKEKGVPFFPDIIFKDAVIALVVFLILVALAYRVGAPLDAKANPADSTYTPRPEWYFLFLFQMLKYFPSKLEVVGVVVIPTLAILLLFFLPLLDRSAKRHYLKRPVVIGVTTLLILGVVFLTVQSVREAPPPAEAASGDQTAALYAKNCAPCHGDSMTVKPGTDLHAVIAQGKHEGMPAWSSDLSSDQIDALAGFILSPGGSKLFTEDCGACHEVQELVGSNPIELKNALDQGLQYPAHANIAPDQWPGEINQLDSTRIINFLIAPDGQRLFTIYCSACHGNGVAYPGDEAQLRTIIIQGGMHLEMPSWQAKLSSADIDLLAKYVVNPESEPSAKALFQTNCSKCHGNRIPKSDTVEQARQTIQSGGVHQTMPVWGQILTEEQITALVNFSVSASKGTALEVGQDLFAKNCALCHGDFGEGGVNPTRTNDIIFPISTAEFLKTRDDYTLSSIIAQGQPNSGMSPFGTVYGGPLDDDQINSIVAYIRSWEANPPVELPPEISQNLLALSGSEIYSNICSQCHGPNGEGGVGVALADPAIQKKYSDEDIYNAISKGHAGSSMIAWEGILSKDQIQALVVFIRQMEPIQPTPVVEQSPQPTPTVEAQPQPSKTPTFTTDILPIFKDKCTNCHGTYGGWDGSNYQSAMTSGDHAPVIIPGDPEGSLLYQKLLGTQKEGKIMPLTGKLPDDMIKIIKDWIAAGAPEK